jgi:hypothetical protein
MTRPLPASRAWFRTRVATFSALLTIVVGVPLASSCDSDARGSELRLAIRSDFGAELGFIRVETLEPTGSGVFETVWVRVGEGCPSRGGQPTTLGSSIDLVAGGSPVSRLRVTGFGPTSDQISVPLLIQQRIDVPVTGTSGFVLIDLTRACRSSSSSCSEEQACVPESGECRAPSPVSVLRALPAATPDLNCLKEVEKPPIPSAAPIDGGVQEAGSLEATAPMDAAPLVDDGDVMRSDHACTTGDGVCPDACSYLDDRDCRSKRGDACNDDAQCEAELSCADGVCCESGCLGDCSRCDLPDTRGYCRDVLIERTLPLNAPNFTAQCASRHLSVKPDGHGALLYTCDDGYRNCAVGSDAVASVIEGGCNTPLGTPDHCTSCDPCPYRYCSKELGCDAYSVGAKLMDGAPFALPVGTAFGISPGVADMAQVLALGALIDRRNARCSVQLALYRDENQSGLPDTMVRATALMNAAIDNSHLVDPAPRPGTDRVEGLLDPPVIVSRDHIYWIFIAATSSCDVWTDASMDYVCRMMVTSTGLPAANPSSSDCTLTNQLSLYAVTPTPRTTD